MDSEEMRTLSGSCHANSFEDLTLVPLEADHQDAYRNLVYEEIRRIEYVMDVDVKVSHDLISALCNSHILERKLDYHELLPMGFDQASTPCRAIEIEVYEDEECIVEERCERPTIEHNLSLIASFTPESKS